MKLPVTISLRHRGKALGLDQEKETLTLLSSTGQQLGSASWEAVIDFIQGSVNQGQSHHAARNFPRSRLAAKVRYLTPNHKQVDSVTYEIGGGGIFIETRQPPQLGTALELELLLPDDQAEPIRAQGKVAWVRPGEEQYVFLPGMGVQFTEISEKGRGRLLAMMKALDRARQGS